MHRVHQKTLHMALLPLPVKPLKTYASSDEKSNNFANFVIMMRCVVSFPKGSELLKVKLPNKLMKKCPDELKAGWLL